jgi:hypothetical protein
MRSSIFSFRALFSLLYFGMAALLAAGVLILLSPAARLRVIGVHAYDYLQLINRSHPDMILVGNSFLYYNIDKERLQSILSQRLGRPIRVLFLAEGGTVSAWWYLVLKHHVATSEVHDIPVGVFFPGHGLTSYNRRLDSHQRWAINKLLTDDDTVFFQKMGDRYRTETKIYHYLPNRLDIAHCLLQLWTNAFLSWLSPRTEAEALLRNRFQVKNLRAWEKLDLGNQDNSPADSQDCVHIPNCVDQTLLPDMIHVMRNNRFFVVEIHPRPGTLSDAFLPQYRRELNVYLKERRIPILSLAKRKELDDIGLYGEGMHVNDRGRPINTDAFADELLRSNLLQPDAGTNP